MIYNNIFVPIKQELDTDSSFIGCNRTRIVNFNLHIINLLHI
jgi:hypothetical protein